MIAPLDFVATWRGSLALPVDAVVEGSSPVRVASLIFLPEHVSYSCFCIGRIGGALKALPPDILAGRASL